MGKKILVIDDDADLCLLVSRFLAKNNYEVTTAHSGAKGLAAYSDGTFDAVICDYRLGDMDGAQLIAALKKINPSVSIVVITGYSDIKTAVEVIKLGAYDYICKPLIPDELLKILQKMLNAPADKTHQSPKKDAAAKEKHEGRFYEGRSPSIRHLYNQVNLVAATNYSIILYGESGTGKEVIAQTIHELSPRNNKPFVALDCGTLSRELAGSELFGHVKGSFTGALQDKVGHFEMADGGTLFLDEVGNLPLEIQAALLRVIQERKFKRIGGNKELPVDVRIIVASNENLSEAYQKGKFREDLYHRFNEFSIHLPPLRERQEDIIPLAQYFLEKSVAETGKDISGFENDVLVTFSNYPWPGNLRELRNVVRRAVLLTEPGKKIDQSALPVEIVNNNTYNLQHNRPLSAEHGEGIDKGLLKEAAIKAEFETIMSVLKQVNNNKKKAAELLNIDRKTLYNKIKNFQSFQQ